MGVTRAYSPFVRVESKSKRTRVFVSEITTEETTIIASPSVQMPDAESQSVSQQEGMLTVDEVAAALRVHPETVRSWMRIGELDAIDIGREYRIYRTDLDDFIQRRRNGKKSKKD